MKIYQRTPRSGCDSKTLVNLNLAHRLPWVKEIDYSVFVSMFNEIPLDFHERFFKIFLVFVN